MADFKSKNLIYKAFTMLPMQDSTSLEHLLREALSVRKKVGQRMQVMDESTRRTHLINHHQGGEDYYGFEFIAYDRDTDPGSLRVNEESEILDVHSILEQGDDRQVLHGTVYGLAAGNHVILIQSAALRCKQLEEHLFWLLQRKSKLLAPDVSIHLADCPKQKELGTPRSIQLASIIDTKSSEPIQDQNVGNDQQVQITRGGPGWGALLGFLRSAQWPDILASNDAELANAIQVTLTLKLKGTRRTASSELLNSVAIALRHVDDEVAYRVKTDTGEFTKSDMKIHRDASIRWGKVQPKWDDLFPKMKDFLSQLIRSRRIPS